MRNLRNPNHEPDPTLAQQLQGQAIPVDTMEAVVDRLEAERLEKLIREQKEREGWEALQNVEVTQAPPEPPRVQVEQPMPIGKPAPMVQVPQKPTSSREKKKVKTPSGARKSGPAQTIRYLWRYRVTQTWSPRWPTRRTSRT
jgi:hypothetical protein